LNSKLLKRQRKYSVKLLKQLIAIPSGNPHVSDADEKEIARFLRDELKNAGFQVKLQPITSTYTIAGPRGHKAFTRPNVIARIGEKNRGPKLILNGHLDTVSGVNMKKPFQPRIQGGKLYGRGSSDMKGGVAAIVAAAESIQASSEALRGELVLSLVVDEETLGLGTKGFLDEESGDLAIVAEPTENTLGLAQAGYLDFDITCKGESRHGQTTLPQAWSSAFLQASNILNQITNDPALIRKQKWNGVKMESTFNATPVRSIERPSLAWMTLEEFTVNCLLGLVPGRSVHDSERVAEAALSRVKHHITNANTHGHNASLTRSTWDIGFIQPSIGCVRGFEKAMREVLGHSKRSYVQSFCDATHFYRAGIPTLLFGPGRMELGHSSNEYVSIRQVKDATGVFTHAIRNMLSK
jgi:acetylornithine deacetylase/succinyl-diaminopimelate desuccinylase-like protein